MLVLTEWPDQHCSLFNKAGCVVQGSLWDTFLHCGEEEEPGRGSAGSGKSQPLSRCYLGAGKRSLP